MYDISPPTHTPPPVSSPDDSKSDADVLDQYRGEQGDRYMQERDELQHHAEGGMVALHDMLNPPEHHKEIQSVLQGFAKGGMPSDAQKSAGNYRKHHVSIHGMKLAIENLAGSDRKGKTKDGKEWSVKMPVHYGYIKKTEGADGDHVDAFVGPHHDAEHVHVIDQEHPDTQKFDEHKAMIGFRHPHDALAAYGNSFSDGRGHERVGAITTMHVSKFKDWLKHGNTKRPMATKLANGGMAQQRFKPPVKPIQPVKKMPHYRDSGMDDGTLSTLRSMFRSSIG